MIKGIYNYLGSYSRSVYGPYILSILIFIEGFFIVPVSTILAFYCLENRRKSILYATIVSISSIFGSFVGYMIGYWLYKNTGYDFIYYLISKDSFQQVIQYYNRYQALTIFVVSLTPIPFKALTITSGFCNMPLYSFLLYSFLARSLKFYTIAISIFFFGDQVKYYIDKYFYYFLIIFILSFIFIFKILH